MSLRIEGRDRASGFWNGEGLVGREGLDEAVVWFLDGFGTGW